MPRATTRSLWVKLIGATILALLLVLGACSGGGDGGKTAEAGDFNILVIVIDTLAAKHLGCYDSSLDNSPVIDRLAAEGVFFNRAYSTAPWTQPAVASLFTSLMPSDNGVQQVFNTLSDSLVSVTELMRERGLWTQGVTSNFIVADEFGFAQGFERMNDSPCAGHDAITSADVTAAAKLVLDRAGRRPFYLYVHYFDPHWTFNHHPAFDRTSGYAGRLKAGMDIGDLRSIRDDLDPVDIAYLENLYREEIAYTDQQVGELLAHLQQLGLDDNTLVVLTADHGEEFMEHGWIGHTASLYDELIHVPLIFHLPGLLAARTVEQPVSLMDVLPTLVDLTGRPAPGVRWQGKSLVGLMKGTDPGDPERPLFAEVSYISPDDWPTGDDQQKRFFKTSLRVGQWKLIHDLLTDQLELYDLANDPGEMTNVWQDGSTIGQELEGLLAVWEQNRGEGGLDPDAEMPEMDAALLKKLRSLGYVH